MKLPRFVTEIGDSKSRVLRLIPFAQFVLLRFMDGPIGKWIMSTKRVFLKFKVERMIENVAVRRFLDRIKEASITEKL